MAIENTLLLKVGGGLVAAGGTTAVGVANKDNISKWFSQILDGKKDSDDSQAKEDDYLFILATKTATSDNSSEALYKTVSEEKIKNYTCKFDSTEYECDIVKKITLNTSDNKKWINTKDLFTEININTSLAKTDLQTEHSLFLLKISLSNKELPDFSTNKTVTISQKENNSDGTKKFAELTSIFVKKNNNLLGGANLFLAKVKDFAIANTTNEYQIESGKTYKCSFLDSEKTPDTNSLKACSIVKFADNQPTDNSKGYSELTFVGGETDLTASEKLIKNNYYIVKFTDAVTTSEFSNKELIYLEVDGDNPKKVVNFSLTTSAFTTSQADNKKLLLLID